MSQNEISYGLEFITTPDLQSSLTEALHYNYSFIVTPIVHPRFRRHYVAGTGEIGGFTRSDMILAPQDWTNRIVGKLSPYIDVNSENPIVAQRHEDCLNEELSYCRGLGMPAVILSLHGRNTNNLSRIIHTFHGTSHFPTPIWASVPMTCNRMSRSSPDNDDNDVASNETWLWWSLFHEQMNWDKKVGVVIELTADLPSQEIIKRWLGEPVKAIIIPTSVFLINSKGFPVLSKAHQAFVVSMVERDAQLVIRGAHRANPTLYAQYLAYMWNRAKPTPNPMLSYAKGWEDYLQTPLQPLADNLDTHTYNVFEQDPIKYDQYQKAIAKALLAVQKKRKDLEDTDTKDEKAVSVMVLGAGRGPLVRATVNAADITKVPVSVIAVEKNPSAVVVLCAQARELWAGRKVRVVASDMRTADIWPRADIIVSELLGSWGDNELSPECLDGAARLLKPGGISIPCQYRSYVSPVSSPRLWGAARGVGGSGGEADKNLETLWVVYMQNKHDLADTKELFTFTHPAVGIKDHEGNEVKSKEGQPLTDNRRAATLRWVARADGVLHGFGGYFDCTLFDDEMISIHPDTHSPGMISWFPVFIPIKTPIRVSAGDSITGQFWRCVSPRRVWYEWAVRVGGDGAGGGRYSGIHNARGRSAEMLL